MDLKQKTAYITAIAAFVAGWGLTIAGFIVEPTGQVHDSVLWILGQALVYTASVLGVTMYFNSQMLKFREETRRFIKREIQEEEREAGDGAES